MVAHLGTAAWCYVGLVLAAGCRRFTFSWRCHCSPFRPLPVMSATRNEEKAGMDEGSGRCRGERVMGSRSTTFAARKQEVVWRCSHAPAIDRGESLSLSLLGIVVAVLGDATAMVVLGDGPSRRPGVGGMRRGEPPLVGLRMRHHRWGLGNAPPPPPLPVETGREIRPWTGFCLLVLTFQMTR